MSEQRATADRDGREEPPELPPDNYVNVTVSPDGARAAMSVGGENWDVWTPDSGRVVLGSTRETLRGLFRTPFDGTGEVERLMTLSEDGRCLLTKDR